MALSAHAKHLLSKLPDADYWSEYPENYFTLSWRGVTFNDIDAHLETYDEVLSLLKQAGAEENVDFALPIGARFIEGNPRRLEIPYIQIISPTLNALIAEILYPDEPNKSHER